MSRDSTEFAEESSKDRRRFVAGMADGALKLKFATTKKGTTYLKVVCETTNHEALYEMRAFFPFKSLSIMGKDDGYRAVAEYAGSSATNLLKHISRYGVAHAKIATLAYEYMISYELHSEEENAKAMEELQGAVAIELARQSKTVDTERTVKIKRKKADNTTTTNEEDNNDKDAPEAPDTALEAEAPKTRLVKEVAPAPEEVEAVAEQINRKWLAGFLETTATIKPTTETASGKKKMGRLVVGTHKMPGGLALAGGIKKKVGAGKLQDKRPRIIFATKKDVEALKGSVQLRYLSLSNL